LGRILVVFHQIADPKCLLNSVWTSERGWDYSVEHSLSQYSTGSTYNK